MSSLERALGWIAASLGLATVIAWTLLIWGHLPPGSANVASTVLGAALSSLMGVGIGWVGIHRRRATAGQLFAPVADLLAGRIVEVLQGVHWRFLPQERRHSIGQFQYHSDLSAIGTLETASHLAGYFQDLREEPQRFLATGKVGAALEAEPGARENLEEIWGWVNEGRLNVLANEQAAALAAGDAPAAEAIGAALFAARTDLSAAYREMARAVPKEDMGERASAFSAWVRFTLSLEKLLATLIDAAVRPL